MSINKADAEAIAKKLKADIAKKNRPHDLAQVFHNGKLVAIFGIRRGSNRNAGHDFIPGNLRITQRQARLLSDCTWSRDDWIDHMIDKGFIDE